MGLVRLRKFLKLETTCVVKKSKTFTAEEVQQVLKSLNAMNATNINL